MSTSGWWPSGPGRSADSPVERWGLGGTSPAGTWWGDAGRPTYDGPAHAPGAGGIGNQPSGTTTTRRPTVAAVAAVQATARRLT